MTVNKAEALLPRSEQIPGESFQVQNRVKAVVMEVRRSGHRVRIVLSRCHPDFVRCLFEQEIPEIQDRTIEIRAVAREAGYRTKIAVSSIDMKVDCVGACVGVRGSRIKSIIDELGGERIDIVRWNDSLQVLIPNALQPAEITDVFLYPKLGRAIVLVAEDQLSLAIGRRGQNVRLASKLVGWDIEIMTVEELDDSLARAEEWFGELPGVTPELIEAFITDGFLSFRDLTFMEIVDLAAMAGISEDDAEEMIAFAEERADEVEEQDEQRAAEEREQIKEAARQAKLGPKILVEEATPAPPPEATGKKAFENLFADESAAAAAPAADGEVQPEGEMPPTEADVTPSAGAETAAALQEHEVAASAPEAVADEPASVSAEPAPSEPSSTAEPEAPAS